jgi:hypothetical protein
MDVEIITTDVYTQNGHIYPKAEMERVIKEFNEREQPMLCELDTRVVDDMFDRIDLQQVSHQVTDLRMEGDKVIATIKVLDTPHGLIMRQLLEQRDHPFVFRPYGVGYLGCDGIIDEFNMLGVSMMHKDNAA